MGREKRTRHAVLGALTFGPMSGYDIRKNIENTIGNFWVESYGQIYPILKELVAENLATVSTDRMESRPERKVYAITDVGLQEVRQWLAEPVTYDVPRNELMLKLFFGRQVGPEVMIRHLQDYRERLQQALQRYHAIEQEIRTEEGGEPDTVYGLATVRYGVHSCQAQIRWCDETLQSLGR